MGPCDEGTVSNSIVQWIRFQSPNGTYKIGDTIDIRVHTGYDFFANNFGINVADSHTLGHSQIRLETGGESDGFANFTRSDTGAHWVEYRYTVRAGDNTSDLDYDSTRALYYVIKHGGTTTRVEDGENGRLRCYLPEPGGPGSLAAHADIGLDGIVPRVANVTVSPPDGGYGLVGDSIEFGVNFDDTVAYSGASPVLTLNLGGGEFRNASYTGGNNTGRFAFAYAVQGGDDASDVEYNGTMALTTAGTMTDRIGNAANLALPASGSLGRPGPIPIDGIRPTVLNVTVSPPDGGYGLGDRIEFNVNFNEAVVYSGAAPVLMLNLSGGETRNATYTSGNNTDRFAFAYEVQGGDDAPNVEYNGTMALTTAGSMIDKAGYAANLTLSASGSLGRSGPVPIDATRPTVLNITSPNGTGPHAEGSIIAVRALFSENVDADTTGGTPRIELSTGAAVVRYAEYDAAASAGRTLAFSYSVTEGDETLDLDYASDTALSENGAIIRDTAGNRATDLTLTDPVAAGPLGALGPIRLDTTQPTVVSVSSTTPDGTYGIDSRIVVTVEFSENMTVDTTGGTPQIALSTGAAGRHAVYDAGASTARTLAFAYTVTEGDDAADLDYSAAAVIVRNGGTIRDAADNDADLELPPPGTDGLLDSGTIRLEAVRPAVEYVYSEKDNDLYPVDTVIDVRVKLGEAVIVDNSSGTPSIRLETGTADRNATLVGGNNSDTLVFTYTVRQGDETDDLNYTGTTALSPNGGTIRDAAGNDADLELPEWGAGDTLGERRDIIIDTAAPVVLSAEAEFLDRIRVTFDDPVASGSLNASAGWSLSGPSAANLSIAALGPVNASAPRDNIVFMLNDTLPNTAPDLELFYDAGAGGIRDEAGNLLQDTTGIVVADRIRPKIVEPLITGNREITIDYTEPVAASPGAYSGLEIGGDARQLDPHDTAPLSRHVITFAGEPAPVPEPPSSMTVDGTAVLDGADPPNPLGDDILTVDIRDGRVLDVFSSRITGPDTAVIAYTRNAEAPIGAYSSLVVGGQNRTITGLVGGDAGAGIHLHTLTFAPGGAPPNATGSVAIDGTAVVSPGLDMRLGNGTVQHTLDDGQSPSVLGTTAISLDTIRVLFSEPVAAPGTRAGGWSVSGRDAAGLAVASSQDAAEPADLLDLTLGGDLPDTAPDAITLSYRPADGGSVEDAAGNDLVASSTSVADGIVPEVRSAVVSGPNEAEVMYTEPVWAAPGAYASVTLSSGGGLRVVSSLAGNGTAVHTVGFGGEPAGPGETGVLEMDATAVRDAALLPLGTDAALMLDLAGAAPPQGNATARAVFAARNAVTITYSAALGPPAGHNGPVYTAVKIDAEGGGGGGTRAVSGVEGLGTAVHTVAFGGDGVGRNQSGAITLAVDLEGTGGQGVDPPRFAAGDIPVASGRMLETVLVAQTRPAPVSIEPDGFTRAVDGTAAGAAARLAINVTGLAGASGAQGTATFPPEAVTLTASFGAVTFPPGVTATSVPPAGALYLYVDGGNASAEAATAALAYPSSGGMILRTIVEAGGGDGADGRITFDMPVRISLEGQAGGRAFYIEGGADGAIVPIDRACAADDTERVHRQLDGMGECRIESGGDMVIHTYHLTRFGTAASERGTPPPVDHTCSMRLGSERLAAQARPGNYSDAAEQAVVNSGSLPFASVELGATPWSVTPLPGAPVQNATLSELPANATLLSTAGSDAGFAPLPAGGASAAVASGLGGGLEAPLWFMLNLTGHAQVEGVELAQRVTYTAECAGAG